jgi:predicted Zn-dependent peptidase
MSREDVVAYYRATYVPSNMTLFVMGDFDAGSLLPVIDSIYGAAPAGTAPAARPLPFPDLPAAGEVRVFHGKAEKGFLFLALPRPESSPSSRLNEVLASYVGRRLQEELVESENPVLFAIDATYESRDAGGPEPSSGGRGSAADRGDAFGRLLLSATFDPSRSPDEVADAILASAAGIGETAPSPDEIERFRVSMKTSDIYLSEKPHMYGMMKAEEIARGGYEEIERLTAAVDSLRPRAVATMSGAFVGLRRAAVAFLPGEPDYTGADLESTVPGEEPVWERPPAEKSPAGRLAILRTPEKGVAASAARSERADTTLANGLRIVVESNDDSKVFALHLLVKNRSWQEPEARAGIADLLHRLLLKGAGESDGAALRARMGRIGAEVKTCDEAYIPYDDYYTTPAYSFVRFTTLDEYAGEGMDLFADMIRRPRLAEEDIASVKEEMVTLARGRLGKPSEVSEALLARALYDGGPLAADPEGSAESIGPITREELLAFRDMYFAPDNLILTAVTSLPARRVASEIARRFDDAARFSKRKPAPPALGTTTADARFEDTLGAKQGSLRIGYVATVPTKDRPALTIAASILSDEIAFDLRETRGLAYSVGAGVSFEGDAGVVAASIGTAAENFTEAEKGIRDHFDRFGKTESLDPLAIEKAVNGILGRVNMRRLSRPNQAFRAGVALLTGRDETWLDDLRGTTAEEVARAARTYIRSSPAATVLVR